MNIDLSVLQPNVKILSGRDVGKKDRQRAKLDMYDKLNEKINVLVSDEVYSINSSYFLGMFGPSIRTLGKKGFLEKFVFRCDDVIRKNIEDGISSALKEFNVLE